MAIIREIKKKKTIPKRLNVAAYARVSCEKGSMLNSLMNQVSYFSEYIQSHKDWNYVGVYSDYGVSGTKASRGNFDELLKHAKNGEVDLILVKSISRFARNLELTLTWIRRLKEINVAIYFEQERINTLTSNGELLISILASSAQEQSRTASMNVLWRVKRNFEKGINYGGDDCYGYTIKDHKFIVIEEQAKVVRRIFELYLEGNGDIKIAKMLNEDKVPTMTGTYWSRTSVARILGNINYTGDLLLQKTYRLDYISKKTKTNHGEKDMYLVEGDHEPIVSKEIFDEVSKLRKSKEFRKMDNTPNHPFTGLLYCAICGKKYGFKKTRQNKKYECYTFNNLGKSYCSSKAVPEDALIKAAMEVLNIATFDEVAMRKKVEKIVVHHDNELEFILKNGEIKMAKWSDRSRSESWTEEMREKARQRNYERNRIHGKDNDNSTED